MIRTILLAIAGHVLLFTAVASLSWQAAVAVAGVELIAASLLLDVPDRKAER